MLDITKRLLQAAEGGEPVFLASLLEVGPRPELVPGARLLVERSGERMGSVGDPVLDDLLASHAPTAFADHAAQTLYVIPEGLSERTVKDATALYIEIVEAKPVFLIVGAGHVGRAIATLADFLDFHVAVLDDREDFANEDALPQADQVICEDFEEALRKFPIDGNTYVTMVTRGHKQDELSLRACLGRGAAYLGMIGSRRRSGAVIQHLKEEGFDPDELARVRTPIGLNIGAESPEEIAVSIMAEVIMMRRGGDGRVMYHR